MKLLAPVRLALRQRAPVLTRGVASTLPRSMPVDGKSDPWVGNHATESEQDVRADNDHNVRGKPSAMMQEETVEELHARQEENDYHEALEKELPKTGTQKNAK